MYAGEVGVPRLLRLFERYDIKTTWFIPGRRLISLTMYIQISWIHARRTQPRDLSGANGKSSRCRTRDRSAWLLSREPTVYEHRAAARDHGQMRQAPDRLLRRQATEGERRAVVGVLEGGYGAFARYGRRIRSQQHGPRVRGLYLRHWKGTLTGIDIVVLNAIICGMQTTGHLSTIRTRQRRG